MKYKIKIDTDAVKDINDAFLWYENQLKDLGKRYKTQVIKDINSLRKNPLLYSTRYSNVHCLKIKKFPFMIHFTVEDYTVNVFAIIHTSKNPAIWNKRKPQNDRR